MYQNSVRVKETSNWKQSNIKLNFVNSPRLFGLQN